MAMMANAVSSYEVLYACVSSLKGVLAAGITVALGSDCTLPHFSDNTMKLTTETRRFSKIFSVSPWLGNKGR